MFPFSGEYVLSHVIFFSMPDLGSLKKQAGSTLLFSFDHACVQRKVMQYMHLESLEGHPSFEVFMVTFKKIVWITSS